MFQPPVLTLRSDKKPNGKYFLDVPTCRKLLASDIDGTPTMPANAPQAPSAADSAALVAKVREVAKGATKAGDVFAVAYGKVPAEAIQAFVAADKRGEITYPIQ